MNTESLEKAVKYYYGQREEAGCAHSETLARHAAGELTGDEQAEFASHLDTCALCQAIWAASAETRPIWTSPSSPRIEPPSVTRRWWRHPGFTHGLTALAAGWVGVVVTWALLDGPSSSNPLVDPGSTKEANLRPRGAAGCTLQPSVQRSGRTAPLRPDTLVKAGDLISFTYTAFQQGYLMILYADVDADPVVIYPADGTQSAPITTGKEVALHEGLVLEKPTSCEWILGLFARQPFDAPMATTVVHRWVSRRKGCVVQPQGWEGMEVQVIPLQRRSK